MYIYTYNCSNVRINFPFIPSNALLWISSNTIQKWTTLQFSSVYSQCEIELGEKMFRWLNGCDGERSWERLSQGDHEQCSSNYTRNNKINILEALNLPCFPFTKGIFSAFSALIRSLEIPEGDFWWERIKQIIDFQNTIRLDYVDCSFVKMCES